MHLIVGVVAAAANKSRAPNQILAFHVHGRFEENSTATGHKDGDSWRDPDQERQHIAACNWNMRVGILMVLGYLLRRVSAAHETPPTRRGQ